MTFDIPGSDKFKISLQALRSPRGIRLWDESGISELQALINRLIESGGFDKDVAGHIDLARKTNSKIHKYLFQVGYQTLLH